MKKIIVLFAAFVFLVLVGCTPKKPVTGLYTDPVEPIVTPIHVEYGPGEQTLEYFMSVADNDKTVVMTVSSVRKTKRQGDALVSDIQLENMDVKDGRGRVSLGGPFMSVVLETGTDGTPIRAEYSSNVLDESQMEQTKKSFERMSSIPKLADQEVVTGSIIYSAQDALIKMMEGQGFAVLDVVFEYRLAGYVDYSGEKVLLVQCNVQDGKLRHVESEMLASIRINNYILLRVGNLLPVYSEMVMNMSFPYVSLDMEIKMVAKEK